MLGAFLMGGMKLNNFRIIYKILKMLENALDYDKTSHFFFQHILSEGLSSANRFRRILIMLCDSGYIDGVTVREHYFYTEVDATNISITLKGLEYLAGDPIMKRIANEEKTEGRLKFDKG